MPPRGTEKEIIAALSPRGAAAPRLCLMLDFDGTLSRLAPTPGKARILPAARRALRELVKRPGITVALISGRDAGDLRRKAGVPGAIYCGNHGLELPGFALPAGAAAAKTAFRRSSSRAKRLLLELADRFPGAWIQEKRFALALHYRAIKGPGRLAKLAAEIKRTSAALKALPGVRPVPGKKVLEAVADAGFDKGSAARLILARKGGTGFYAGDDVTDENAFRALRGRAVTVFSGPPGVPTAARFRLSGPAGMAALLTAIAEALKKKRGGE